MKVLIASSEKATAKNNSEFLRLHIIDEDKKSKQVVWFDPPRVDVAGKVCDIDLRIPDNPAHKPAITRFKISEDQDRTPFLRRSEVTPKVAYGFFFTATRNQGPITQIIDDLLFDKESRKCSMVRKRFAEWPAAKRMHHAFSGGLLEHTYAMGRAAKFLMEKDPSYQGLDKGVVYAAVLLHDLAKIMEYEWEAPGPAERTDKGVLLGHITMGDEAVIKSCIKLGMPTNKGRVLHLRHCMLSHHGRREWGSPVSHSTREAVLVHQLDMIQSRGQMAFEAMEAIDPGKFETHSAMDCVLYNIQEEDKNE